MQEEMANQVALGRKGCSDFVANFKKVSRESRVVEMIHGMPVGPETGDEGGNPFGLLAIQFEDHLNPQAVSHEDCFFDFQGVEDRLTILYQSSDRVVFWILDET